MSPGPDVFFITQLESRKSILGKPHSGNIFPRVLERFNWSSEKENNSGVCVCVCVCVVCVWVCVCVCVCVCVSMFFYLFICVFVIMFVIVCLVRCLYTLSMDCSPPGSSPGFMGSSRQEYWSGLPCSPLGDLPDPEIKPASLRSPTLADRLFTTSAP